VFQNIVVPVNPKDSNGSFVYDEKDDFGTTEQEVKVQSTSLTKTVRDGNVADSAYGETINTLSTGDTASFKLDVAVPFYNTDALSKTGATNGVTFSIVDTLDTTYVKTPTNVAVSADGVTLAKDTDYSVATTDATLTVTFTPTGLTKLNSSEPSANTKAATITYDATVVATAGTTGVVDINDAVLTFSKSSADPTKTNTTSDKVQAQFYSLTVQKHGSDTGDSLLAGAEFALAGQNLSPSATSTDTNGTYTFPVALGSGDAFTLSETTAPSGYLKVADQTVTAEDGNVTVTITDQKDNASILPSTGGAGTIGLTVAGVAIMAGAAAFVARSRKQND
jgi:LPXTG-motif cell wall-anchored protein